uniref:Uncharacterized protein n=1 Tax=Anguilla anguilla TaxID=7936 RepID=A0A0E9T6P1_ANGAN
MLSKCILPLPGFLYYCMFVTLNDF